MKLCLSQAILLQGVLCPGEAAHCGAALNFSQLCFADGPERLHLFLQMEQLQLKANTWAVQPWPPRRDSRGTAAPALLQAIISIWIINAVSVVNEMLRTKFSTTHLHTANNHGHLSTHQPPQNT